MSRFDALFYIELINLFTLILNALKQAEKGQISGVMGFYYILCLKKALHGVNFGAK